MTVDTTVCCLCKNKITGDYIVKIVNNKEEIYCHPCYTRLKIQLPVQIRRIDDRQNSN
jgi:hypothetical protein